jgi:hypothetical protein
MHKHEAIFWYMGEDEDTISPRMCKVVQQVENITRAAVKANSGVTSWLPSLLIKRRAKLKQ